ncbi:MAG: MBL fold metallo-hydrolase [Deltaproteobacteria bacterium]|nr:MAG: MBL fold metallo-hydrolase [Deltaproteobacteria bacterium]
MQEFLPDVFIWSWFSEPHGYDFHGTLLLSAAGNLCIDPVDPSEEVLDRLAKEGVAQILITNRNHTRAANRVRERTGAKVAIHPADAAYAREQGTAIDAELGVGESVGPFNLLGVPGKSPGEIALHDPARRLLVVGDAVIGNPPGQLSLLRERVMDDPALLRASVRSLLELDFDTLMVGDGVSIREGGRERLRELVASFPTD